MPEDSKLESVVASIQAATDFLEPRLIKAIKTRQPQISDHENEVVATALAEFRSVFEVVRTGMTIELAHGESSIKSRPAVTEQTLVQKVTEPIDKKARKHDHVFDFIALEYLKYQEKRNRLASKAEMLRALKAYDPRATETSLGPTLHKWKNEPKNWITWPPRDLDNITLTDEGKAHLRSILRHGKGKREEVTEALRTTVDPAYEFTEEK